MAKVLHGVAFTASVAGFATAVVTPAVNRDGIKYGASLCEMRLIICVTRTFRNLKQPAENFLLIHGRRAMTASLWFSILVSRAKSFFSITRAVGYHGTNRSARSPISNCSGCCC